MRNAGSDRDRPGMHVSVIDVPAFLAGISGAAAGEGGHGAPLKRGQGRQAIVLGCKIAARFQWGSGEPHNPSSVAARQERRFHRVLAAAP